MESMVFTLKLHEVAGSHGALATQTEFKRQTRNERRVDCVEVCIHLAAHQGPRSSWNYLLRSSEVIRTHLDFDSNGLG